MSKSAEDILYEKEIGNTVCNKCLYRKNFGVQKAIYPCCCCKLRPDRKQDKNEFVEQLSEPEDQAKHSNERTGEFNY